MNKDFAKSLDSILKAFTLDFNKEKSIDELVNILFEKEIKTKPDNKNYSATVFGKMFDFKDYTKYCLNFLKDENLIDYSEEKELVKIKSKGFLKIRTEGFYQKIKNDKRNLWLQRSVWISIIITLFLNIFIQIIKPSFFNENSNPKINSICDCKCKY